MFNNFLKIALRTLLRNKAYAFINILGLSIGIAGAAMLTAYVEDEISFDTYHQNSDRIVRPILIENAQDGQRFYASSPAIFSETLKAQLPEVVEVNYLTQFIGGQFNLRVGEKRFTERNYFVTNNAHFRVFDYDFILGDKNKALTEPFQIVLSRSKAQAVLGSLDVLGSFIEVPGFGEFQVVGVFEDLPKNTHLQIDLLVSHSFSGQRWESTSSNWNAFGGESYLLLTKDFDLDKLTAKANEIYDKNEKNLIDEVDFKFQPLSDIHFGSNNIESDMAANKGERNYVFIFMSISLFLVLLASVNYMNLATTKAAFRAKEIGVRKVVGANKSQLVVQFLMESLILTLVAMVFAIGLIDLAMPFFNQLTGKAFEFSLGNLSEYLPSLVLITLLIALLSGLYPAFFMTRLETVSILKGNKSSGGNYRLRQGLVVFQFVMGIFMIISTLVVGTQMGYIKNKELGFNQENLLVIDINNGAVRPVFKTMRNELGQIPGVEKVSVTSRVPGEWKIIKEVYTTLVDDEGVKIDSAIFPYMSFDPYALDVFDIKLKEGVNFIGNDVSDSKKILLNEKAVKRFGFENPIGEKVRVLTNSGTITFEVIGVLEDFNFESLHTEIRPIIIGAWNNPAHIIDYFTLKISGDPQSIIEKAGLVHEQFDNRTVMEYHFLDQQLDTFYHSENQAAVIFKLGSGLSLFIACLGLFGLASFTVQKRVKELGIRKVLGASVWRLFSLLSSALIKQIMIAFAVASPIAYYFMRNWLNNFEYQTSIDVWIFVVSGLATLVVAMITISYRSLKAAHANPVDSLRSE